MNQQNPNVGQDYVKFQQNLNQKHQLRVNSSIVSKQPLTQYLLKFCKDLDQKQLINLASLLIFFFQMNTRKLKINNFQKKQINKLLYKIKNISLIRAIKLFEKIIQKICQDPFLFQTKTVLNQQNFQKTLSHYSLKIRKKCSQIYSSQFNHFLTALFENSSGIVPKQFLLNFIQCLINKRELVIKQELQKYEFFHLHQPLKDKYYRKCRFCSRGYDKSEEKKTQYICLGCKVGSKKQIALCLGCFQNFHKQNKIIDLIDAKQLKKWQKLKRRSDFIRQVHQQQIFKANFSQGFVNELEVLEMIKEQNIKVFPNNILKEEENLQNINNLEEEEHEQKEKQQNCD